MLHLDHEKRLTAVEALAEPWFDSMREPEVEQLIQNDRERKHLRLAQAEAAASQYTTEGNEGRSKRRGESSKSRASMRSTNNQNPSLAESSAMSQIGQMSQMG